MILASTVARLQPSAAHAQEKLRILAFRRNAGPLRNDFCDSVFLHSLRYAYLEQGQDVLENFLDAQAQIYSRRAQVLVVAVDATGVVELVEEGREVDAVTCDACGIIVFGGEGNFVGERR